MKYQKKKNSILQQPLQPYLSLFSGTELEPEIKEERSKALIELNNINEKAFSEKYLDKEVEVLIEQEVKSKDGVWEGYTRNYLLLLLYNF